ncbi:TraR/DksA C4-type zinc finger protein [Alcaligenaceae bacterium Me47]
MHCIRCGDEISAARRAAYPAARRCVECQSDYDSERG